MSIGKLEILENAAELRAFHGTEEIVGVLIKGLSIEGDGGAGIYFWDNTTRDPVDDGQNIIIPRGSIPGFWRRTYTSDFAIGTFAANNTTPSVKDGTKFRTANTVATTITTFAQGTLGQQITVVIGDDFTTIDFTGTNLVRASGTDYVAIEEDILTGVFDGTNWNCAITSREPVVWDDIKFPLTRSSQGINSKPDYDYTELGLLFPQDSTSEVVNIVAELPHAWKLESSIRPHIHLMQDEEEVPVFKLEYRWYKNGDTPPSWTTLTTTGAPVFTYVSGTLAQILVFPLVSGAGIDTVSSVLDIKLYRDDDVVAGDVLGKSFDIHIQKDSNGSREEVIKW